MLTSIFSGHICSVYSCWNVTILSQNFMANLFAMHCACNMRVFSLFKMSSACFLPNHTEITSTYIKKKLWDLLNLLSLRSCCANTLYWVTLKVEYRINRTHALATEWQKVLLPFSALLKASEWVVIECKWRHSMIFQHLHAFMDHQWPL